MARKQCQVCGQPATVRVEANLNGRHSTMLLCDDHYRQLVRQQKRTVSPLEALFGSRSGLFEDFLGSDFFRIGDDAPSMAADTDEVVDASFGEPAPAGTGTARRRGSGLASRISEQSEALLQEAALLPGNDPVHLTWHNQEISLDGLLHYSVTALPPPGWEVVSLQPGTP